MNNLWIRLIHFFTQADSTRGAERQLFSSQINFLAVRQFDISAISALIRQDKFTTIVFHFDMIA